MSGDHAYFSRLLPSTLAILLMVGLALYGMRRRNIPGVLPFMITNLFGALWMLGSLMEQVSAQTAGQIFWIKFAALWQLPAATSMTCFVLEYAWPGRWLTRRNLALLAIPPVIVLGFIATDHIHHLMWQGFHLNGIITPLLGPAGWSAVAFSFVLVFINMGIFVWLFIRSPQHRFPVAIMMLGHVGFRALFLYERARNIRTNFVLDEIGLVFIVLMYSIALYGFRIFDPIPFARQTVLNQLKDGVVVLNLLDQIASMNPAAETIANVPLKQARNQPVGKLFPMIPELDTLLQSENGQSKPIDLQIGTGVDVRWYELMISTLADFRKLAVGKVILFRDVTAQRLAQAKVIDQQRSLATLQERDRLARELHDELAQELALINLQSQLVTTLLDQGQEEQAKAQLQVLARAAREAHVDVREEISTLSNHNVYEKGFLETVQNFLNNFEKTYGIKTELVQEGNCQTAATTPVIEVQLMRIIQEAFTNIRKHARANHVKVSIINESNFCKLSVVDDGVGFSLDTPPTARQTFGLGIMSKRAREINGWVDIESGPGKGTQVTVTFPVNNDRRGMP